MEVQCEFHNAISFARLWDGCGWSVRSKVSEFPSNQFGVSRLNTSIRPATKCAPVPSPMWDWHDLQTKCECVCWISFCPLKGICSDQTINTVNPDFAFDISIWEGSTFWNYDTYMDSFWNEDLGVYFQSKSKGKDFQDFCGRKEVIM